MCMINSNDNDEFKTQKFRSSVVNLLPPTQFQLVSGLKYKISYTFSFVKVEIVLL
jgi:hypothetical protein